MAGATFTIAGRGMGRRLGLRRRQTGDRRPSGGYRGGHCGALGAQRPRAGENKQSGNGQDQEQANRALADSVRSVQTRLLLGSHVLRTFVAVMGCSRQGAAVYSSVAAA